MCGILGHIPFCNEHNFKSSLDRLSHRGPDGFGIWSDEHVSLGHRRLSILDLSVLGKQPMAYLHYVITFNGEIYNFIELRKRLLKQGYTFQTETDTEVVMAAYDAWGEKCVHEFNGMWAFAIWNTKSKELFISRDRFGVKPLFYYLENKRLIFSSEMKALMPFLPEIRISDKFQWMKTHIFSYENTEDCLVKHIRRFPAGSNAVYNYSTGELKIEKYWDTKAHLHQVPAKYEEQVEKFRELFIDACRIRMRSDVPVGTALSGGLDSSATISTMALIGKAHQGERISEDWQHAVVASFPGAFLDETEYARKVTDHLKIKAEFVTIDAGKAIDKLEDYLYLFEELYLTSPVPMMETYGAIRKAGIVVTLDGHGADELLTGYGKDIFSAFLDCGFNLTKIKNILRTYSGLRDIDHEQLQKEVISMKTYFNWLRPRLRGRKSARYHFLNGVLGRSNRVDGIPHFGSFNTLLYDLYHNSILPTLLRNYDRYSMANSVEIRMPFLDYRLATFCFSLPWESKLNNGYTKTILRDAMKGIVTEDIRLRKTKIGFNTPIVDWMKGPWKEYLLDMTHSKDFNACQLIDSTDVRNRILKVIESPSALYTEGETAWSLLTPYLWEKSFLKRDHQFKG